MRTPTERPPATQHVFSQRADIPHGRRARALARMEAVTRARLVCACSSQLDFQLLDGRRKRETRRRVFYSFPRGTLCGRCHIHLDKCWRRRRTTALSPPSQVVTPYQSVPSFFVRHEEEERGGRLRKVNEEVNATKHGVILRGKEEVGDSYVMLAL